MKSCVVFVLTCHRELKKITLVAEIKIILKAAKHLEIYETNSILVAEKNKIATNYQKIANITNGYFSSTVTNLNLKLNLKISSETLSSNITKIFENHESFQRIEIGNFD